MAKLLFLVTAATTLATSISLADGSNQAPSAGFPGLPGLSWMIPPPPAPGWMPPPPWFYQPMAYSFPQLFGTAGKEVVALRKQLREREQALAEARSAAESLVGERDEWQAQLEQSKNEAAAAYGALGAAQSRVALLTGVLEAAESERDEVVSREAVAEHRLARLEADVSQVKAALGACTERVAELSEERGALVDRLDQAGRVAAENGEALKRVRARAVELEAALAEAGGRSDALAADNHRLHAEVESLQAKLSASSDALSESGLLIERLSSERNALRAERDQAAQLGAAESGAQEPVDAKTAEMSSLEVGAEPEAGGDAGQHGIDQASQDLPDEIQAKSSPRPASLQAP